MTAPRQVLAGTTYLVTRRCAHRQFFLRPSPAINGIFLYVLAVAAERYGIAVHAFCVMSNHWHAVVTDPDARLPAFEQYLDGLVARAVNTYHRRREDFWGPPTYSAVALASPSDVVAKAAYVLANPVAAGLVERGAEWPGLWSDPATFGLTIEAARPHVFFSATGTMPVVAQLVLTPPEGFQLDEWRDKVMVAAAGLEREARDAVAAAGRSFSGVVRVLAQRVTAIPAEDEPVRMLNPRVAARDKWKRVEVLQRLVEFSRRYRAAWRARRAGQAEVVFPLGTYHLRVAHGVVCAAAG